MNAVASDVQQCRLLGVQLATADDTLGQVLDQIGKPGFSPSTLIIGLRRTLRDLARVADAIAARMVEREKAAIGLEEIEADARWKAAYDLETKRLCREARLAAAKWPENERTTAH